jgi:hypothetical protein
MRTSSALAATERGDDGPASPTTPSTVSATVAAAAYSAASAGWGRDAFWPSLVGGDAGTTAVDSAPAADSSGTASASSDVAGEPSRQHSHTDAAPA